MLFLISYCWCIKFQYTTPKAIETMTNFTSAEARDQYNKTIFAEYVIKFG